MALELVSLLIFFCSLFFVKSYLNLPSKLFFYTLIILSIIIHTFNLSLHFLTGQWLTNAAIYHLSYGLNGAAISDFYDVIFLVAFLFSCTAAILYLVNSSLFQVKFLNKNSFRYIGFFIITLSIFINPSIHKILKLQNFSPVYSNDKTLQINSSTKDSSIRVTDYPENLKRNIVFIFAESMERTFIDRNNYSHLLENLSAIENQSLHFTNIIQLPRTDWTIAGMTASLCGIPFIHPSGGNTLNNVEEFFPGAICLGDILKKYEYSLMFYQGSTLNFAGTKKLFQGHGFETILGKDELIKNRNSLKLHSWGLYDHDLLEIAFKEFKNRIENGDKAALFLATIDTHFPNGYIHDSCDKDILRKINEPILKAFKCSDAVISGFINSIRNDETTKDSIIIVVSDHLLMGKESIQMLGDYSDRRNLFFINDNRLNNTKSITKKGGQVDIPSTILAYLGKQQNIGVGVNLLSKDESIVNNNDVEVWLKQNQNEILKLWDFQKSSSDIEINEDLRIVKVGNKKYIAPVLLRISENSDSEILPYFNEDEGKLFEHLATFQANEYFVLVDECSNLNRIFYEFHHENGLCYFYGSLGDTISFSTVQKNNVIKYNKLISVPSRSKNKQLYSERQNKLKASRFLSRDQRWLLSKVPKGSLVYLSKYLYLPFDDYHRIEETIEKHYKIKVTHQIPYTDNFFALHEGLDTLSLSYLYNLEIVDDKTTFFVYLKNTVKLFLNSFFNNKYKIIKNEVIFFEFKDEKKRRSKSIIESDLSDMSKFIVHAGGTVNDDKYINSKEGLDLLYKRGFKLFELDLQETSDNKIVAVHDWDEWKRRNNFEGEVPPTLAEFKQIKVLGKYTPIDIDDISKWFGERKDAILVTDKINNPRLLLNKFPYKDRLMMEVFTLDAAKEALNLKIKSTMLTWSVVASFGHDKVKNLRELGITDIAISREEVSKNIKTLMELKELGIKSYVFNIHTDNIKGETQIICKDMHIVHGMYFDRLDLQKQINCN